MSYLLIVNSILFGLALLGIIIIVRGAAANRERSKLNELVSDELQVIIQAAQRTLKNQREIEESVGKNGLLDLHDPVMLSTLITVMVTKHGTLRLNMEDFDTISEDEFVSVYIDTGTNELILSLNHDLGKPDTVLAQFSGGDDTTFH
tara:strand:- start:1040 stop:1480 length:441 start_codon:yes stop_codon:yes gene_type:complete